MMPRHTGGASTTQLKEKTKSHNCFFFSETLISMGHEKFSSTLCPKTRSLQTSNMRLTGPISLPEVISRAKMSFLLKYKQNYSIYITYIFEKYESSNTDYCCRKD
jgi:hypothetical protein